jgi:hypothetical protein
MGKVVSVVGVVVAVDVPDAFADGRQLGVQRACGFQVTQQDDGAGVGLQGGIKDVLPLAVRVTAKKDGAGVSVLHWLERITPKFKHQTLEFRDQWTLRAHLGGFLLLDVALKSPVIHDLSNLVFKR